MEPLASWNRNTRIEQASQQEFDLIVVGGGIVGVGIFFQAIRQGFSVLLLEKKDWASGTSSRSSKLLHGGIRYLEQGHWGLVREALQQRNFLVQWAYPLAQRLDFVIPIYKNSRLPFWLIRAGLMVYDLFSGNTFADMSWAWNYQETLAELDGLNGSDLIGGVGYWDGVMEDERLLMAIVELGLRLSPASSAINYSEVSCPKIMRDFWEVPVYDHIQGKRWLAKAKQVIVAVGPWTDVLRQKWLGKNDKVLSLSVGSHLTFHKQVWPDLKYGIVLPLQHRIIFVIPRWDYILVGTTEEAFKGQLDRVEPTNGEIHYLLEALNYYFPKKDWKKNITGAFAGVRPLIFQGNRSLHSTSREERIWQEGGLIWVAGGKYTTFLKMGEKVVKLLEEKGLEPSVEPIREMPNLLPLPFDSGYQAHGQPNFWNSSHERAWRMRFNFQPYSHLSYHEAELDWALKHTQVLFLDDFFRRRVSWIWQDQEPLEDLVEPLGRFMGKVLGWSTDELNRQIQVSRDYLKFIDHFRIKWRN